MEIHLLEEQRELRMALELEREQNEKLQQRITELEEENRILKAKTEVALRLMALALDFDAIGKAHSNREGITGAGTCKEEFYGSYFV